MSVACSTVMYVISAQQDYKRYEKGKKENTISINILMLFHWNNWEKHSLLNKEIVSREYQYKYRRKLELGLASCLANG